MSNSQQVFNLARTAVRHFSKSQNLKSAADSVQEVPSKAFQHVKEAQKRFGIDDGVPVYLKGGVVDKLLYGVTLAITTVTCSMTLQTWYEITFPKK